MTRPLLVEKRQDDHREPHQGPDGQVDAGAEQCHQLSARHKGEDGGQQEGGAQV
jgi:hypothetical protein